MRGTPKLSKRAGSPFWYITFSQGRRSRRYSTGTGDRTQAERILAQFLLERQRPQVSDADLIQITDMLERYQATRPNDATIGYHLKHLKPFLQGMALSQFTRGTVREYIEHRMNQNVTIGKGKSKRKVSPSTIRRELDTLSAALNFAKREGHISEIPHIEKPLAAQPRERWLTHEEVERLFEASAHSKNLTAYLHVAMNTGARPSSILELKWFQADFEKRLIHFNPEGRLQNNKHRPTIYINDSLMDFLPKWRKKCKSEYVCGGVKSVKAAFGRACVKAKISGATPYTLRHTAITWAIRDGHSLALAGQLAGHRDPRTTMRYAKHDPSFTSGVTASLATGVQLAHKIAKKGKKHQKAAKKRVKKQ